MKGSSHIDDFSAHCKRFLDYTDSFKDVPDAAPLRLKVEHTFKVYEHAKFIVSSLKDSIYFGTPPVTAYISTSSLYDLFEKNSL